jgi:hypothetical protein
MKNGAFWVVTPCGSCKNRRFGGTWHLLHQGDKIGELETTQAATSNRRTLRKNPEDTILHRQRVFEKKAQRRIFEQNRRSFRKLEKAS